MSLCPAGNLIVTNKRSRHAEEYQRADARVL